jgi:hypothetical protein
MNDPRAEPDMTAVSMISVSRKWTLGPKSGFMVNCLLPLAIGPAIQMAQKTMKPGHMVLITAMLTHGANPKRKGIKIK